LFFNFFPSKLKSFYNKASNNIKPEVNDDSIKAD
jgi:hypothetical protein